MLKNTEKDVDSLFHAEQLSNPPQRAKDPLDVEHLTEEELFDVLSRVYQRLPMQLTDLNLEQELMLQYRQTKLLMHSVVNDKATPANQRAQVANSCASVLDQINKMQTRLYTAERLKMIEQALVKAVKQHLPAEAQAQFFEAYEKIYNNEEAKK
jgi:hemoglobin-like flavoprotein